MKKYHNNQPSKVRKIAETTKETRAAKKPSILTILFYKLSSNFAPLTKFQKALTYTGTLKKKPSKFQKWFAKNAALISILEKIVVFGFIIFSLFTNAYLLLILPVAGGLIFYRARVNWLWWKVKVFILQRNFYEHRRNLYKQGSLFHHFDHKEPKRYKTAIIWGESGSVQDTRFKNLQKNIALSKIEFFWLWLALKKYSVIGFFNKNYTSKNPFQYELPKRFLDKNNKSTLLKNKQEAIEFLTSNSVKKRKALTRKEYISL